MQTDVRSQLPENPLELSARIKAALCDSASLQPPGSPLVKECEVSLERTPDAVDSAVLVLVLKYQDENYLVFTRRPNKMRTSPGEIVLPGGRIEEGESAQAAALRECREETGIQVGAESVIGELPGFLRALRKDYWITPVVAMVEVGSLEFSANPDEVEEVILTPVRWWLERSSEAVFFPVNAKCEHPAKGNAFALEVLKQRLDSGDQNNRNPATSDATSQAPAEVSRWWEGLEAPPEALNA